MVESVAAETAMIRKEASKPKRQKMPGQRPGQIIKFEIGGSLDGFLIIGTYPDGRCGEVFGRLGRCGSFAHGMFESFCKAFSVMLQWGVPLDKAIHSFKNLAFDPAGFARVADGSVDADVKSCKSVVDLMMRILEWLFPAERNFRIRIDGYYDFVAAGEDETVEFLREGGQDKISKAEVDLGAAEMCPECHSLAMIQDGRCKRCSNCGFSNGGCGG
jgi:ribonucleoside-diphosphate reductase alpha chain